MSTPAVRDPGLQPERTRLAWRRTTLSCTLVAVLAARAALHRSGGAAGVLALAACCLLWIGFLALAHHRLRALVPARPAPLPARWALGAVCCAAGLAVAAGVLVASPA
ncbi:DUF202 domain-containing protein [Streptomyces albidoflavus]|uniref:DUF202 domain-containing protein n=1 Tax=Streptomyces albidoflavus TaxID=1886 RepID=UPI00101E2D7D|nr:DUF202 domain-containing protein [Streptomyces albidoflavus]RZD80262.1 hypothetical protein C0Q63_27295 [Streptomyces albidoflavus]